MIVFTSGISLMWKETLKEKERQKYCFYFPLDKWKILIWEYIPWLLELTTQAPDTDQKQLISTAYLNKEGELPPPCSFYSPTKYCDWREAWEPALLTPSFTCGNKHFHAVPLVYESLDTDRDSESSEVPRYHSIKPPCSFFSSSAITLEF